MAQISYVLITRQKKEMIYEQCVNLSIKIMKLFEKNLIYMHLGSAKQLNKVKTMLHLL